MSSVWNKYLATYVTHILSSFVNLILKCPHKISMTKWIKMCACVHTHTQTSLKIDFKWIAHALAD